MALAAVALTAALWGALARLGLGIPAPDTFTASHGLLMTMGFLGTVIGMERAVALGKRAGYAAPVLGAAGAAALLVGLPVALWILAAAGIAFALTCAYMWRLRPELPIATMAVGGIAWAAAAVGVALGLPVSRSVPLLAAFLILTVVGERVELSKLARPPRWSAVPFALGCALLVGGAAGAIVSVDATRVAGVGLIVLAAWLGRWDIAWRSVRRSGVTRYMAAALLAGYAWLAVAGVVWVAAPDASTLFAYDALIHTVVVGFVLSMIFAHALMIVPAILGIPLTFTRAFYAPLALLHGSLAARIAGDAVGDVTVWQWASIANVLAVLLFVAVSVRSARLRPPDAILSA